MKRSRLLVNHNFSGSTDQTGVSVPHHLRNVVELIARGTVTCRRHAAEELRWKLISQAGTNQVFMLLNVLPGLDCRSRLIALGLFLTYSKISDYLVIYDDVMTVHLQERASKNANGSTKRYFGRDLPNLFARWPNRISSRTATNANCQTTDLLDSNERRLLGQTAHSRKIGAG